MLLRGRKGSGAAKGSAAASVVKGEGAELLWKAAAATLALCCQLRLLRDGTADTFGAHGLIMVPVWGLTPQTEC